MQIEELLRLSSWFDDNVLDREIPDQFEELLIVMRRNLNRSNQQLQPIEEMKLNLLDSLNQVSIDNLTLEQISFLKKIEVFDLITPETVNILEDVLYKNSLDLATAVNRISQFSEKLNEGVRKINDIQAALLQVYTLDEIEEIPENSVLIRVYFQEGVSINNISDFKKLATIWYDIGRGIAFAQDKSPEDFKIIGAQKGSIIMTMAVLTSIATSVSIILLRGLKVAERILEVLKKAEELKSMKLSNKKIAQDLENEAETLKKREIDSILEDIAKELNIKEEGDKIAALKKAITKLMDFTQNGGMVDIIDPDANEENEENPRAEVLKLKSNVEEIRRIENKIKLLSTHK